ncbi:MAG TPA: hydantoinase B/oxoprolinase family protein, partial [Gaiellales bacterium]|nr:hydantoinase B/oxoprolinase family protein [Gaiellales bacterium]
PGGEGVVRRYRVLADCRLSLMTERRGQSPRGAAGGGDGAPGRNLLNGRPLAAKLTRSLRAGDVVEIRTPGGGGFGVQPDDPGG